MPDFPPLTVLEEFLLLALDDEAGAFYDLPFSVLNVATAGAVLMDLVRHRRVDCDLANAFVIDSAPTGDDLLDPVLAAMAAEPVLAPHPVAEWLRRLGDGAEEVRLKALRRLEARGIVRHEDKKILWVFGSRRYPIVDDREAREVKSRILELILGHDIPDPHDTMIASLADACGLFRHMLGGEDLERSARRIAQIARLDLIGQAVLKAVAGIEAEIAAAAGIR